MPAKKPRGYLESLKQQPGYKLLPEQLENESDYDYLLFAYYCFLGCKRSYRSMRLVFDELASEALPANDVIAQIRFRALDYKWNDRAKFFDCQRISQMADQLIKVDAKIDAGWIEKRKESREILQKSLSGANQLIDCVNFLVAETLYQLQEGRSVADHCKISKTLADCAAVMERTTNIIRGVWEQKENIYALEAGRNFIESALSNEYKK